MRRTLLLFSLFTRLLCSIPSIEAKELFLVFEPEGTTKGKNIVLISGDEEYRSEESFPQLAKILATYHGFRCTVLFAIDRRNGTINPEQLDNIPGLEALDSADLMVILTRFRDLPDDQMKHIVDYVESGKPIVGMRTATHAFQLKSSPTFARYSWDSPGGGVRAACTRRNLDQPPRSAWETKHPWCSQS